jgi:hypothetical protein
MKEVILYTGNGVSLSPVYAEGRAESKYVRLVADDGKAITNGETVSVCVDVLKENAFLWTDCDLPEDEAEPLTETEQKAKAYDILMGVTE